MDVASGVAALDGSWLVPFGDQQQPPPPGGGPPGSGSGGGLHLPPPPPPPDEPQIPPPEPEPEPPPEPPEPRPPGLLGQLSLIDWLLKHQAHVFDDILAEREVMRYLVDSMVVTILGSARFLGLTVVAEGVETEEQFSFLRDYHCELFQGNLFSCALPTTEFEEYYWKHRANNNA